VSRVLTAALALVLVLAAADPVAATEEPKHSNPAAPAAGEIIPGEVVVKWRDSGQVESVTASHGLTVVADLGASAELVTVVTTKGRAVETVVAELEANPAVEYAEPNYVVTLANEGSVTGVSVNDPQTAGQYSLDRMRVRDAWSHTTGGSNVIAVLDTGVQANHPDLSGRVLPGYNFVSSTTNAADDNGHGTWVAGIIAANANNGYGIAGISWTDKILPVKIMNSSGTGSTSNLTSGIVWAANNGAHVINMSVGGFPYSKAVEDAVNYAWNKGAVLVGAAGNNGRQEDFYPASYANVVNVSATQVDDEFSHWSSYGPKVEVSAPGSSVLTTNCTASSCPNASWGSHTYISGTSFATPNVAGVIALIKARYPSYTPSQIVYRLYSTVDDLGYPGRDHRYGRGRVNALRAVGGTAAYATVGGGDALEPNNTLASAKLIGLGTTTRPSLYPAGDVDWFAVDVPRAGRLDVRVGGVVDTRPYPWNKSSLPIDPIVELYTTSGTLIKRVDDAWESGIELAQHTVSGPTRILVRITNYYANGNKTAYWIEPTYVDTVPPSVTTRLPAPGAVNTSRFPAVTVGFSEQVANVTASTIRLRDTVTNALVSATVSYDSARREARLSVTNKLAAERRYQVEATSGVRDAAGNALVPVAWSFTTGVTGFSDTVGSPHEYDIAWLEEAGITGGCGGDRFCPKASVTREQMASFIARGFKLPSTTRDYFTDDSTSAHQGDINRLAASGITGGCAPGRFCPKGSVTREQMASFLSRALKLPAATRDHFTDDNGSPHEGDINRLAQAGITGGCGGTSFCPKALITREQMAAFLRRALDR
jgi:subtilisin family serine protease